MDITTNNLNSYLHSLFVLLMVMFIPLVEVEVLIDVY